MTTVNSTTDKATATQQIDPSRNTVTLSFSTATEILQLAEATMITRASSLYALPGGYTIHSPHTHYLGYLSTGNLPADAPVHQHLAQAVQGVFETADWMRKMTRERLNAHGRPGDVETVTVADVKEAVFEQDAIASEDSAEQISAGYETIRRFMQNRGITAETYLEVEPPSAGNTLETLFKGQFGKAVKNVRRANAFERRIK